MGVPLYVTCCFSLVAFNILSLSLIFATLTTMCLAVVLFELILSETLCAYWTWVSVSFPKLEMFSAIMSSRKFSAPFSLSSNSGTPIMQMLCLMLSLKLSSFLFFFFFPFSFSDFYYSVFQFADPFLCII